MQATNGVLLYLHSASIDPEMTPHDTPPLPADMHRDTHAKTSVYRSAEHMHPAAQPCSKICEHPSHPGTSSAHAHLLNLLQMQKQNHLALSAIIL
jgi:hypothetical protein